MNVSINPRSHPHLERGALTIGATAALFAVWFGIGLPGVPFVVPGLASGGNESPSTTELYARAPAVARAHDRVATSTPAGARRRTRAISTQLTLPAAPAAPVVRTPPPARGGTTTTDRTSTSSPKNDPQHATDADPPASALQPAPPPVPPTVNDVPKTVEDSVTAVTSVVETTVNTVESAVPAVLSAADAVQTLVPAPPSLLPGSTKPKP